MSVYCNWPTDAWLLTRSRIDLDAFKQNNLAETRKDNFDGNLTFLVYRKAGVMYAVQQYACLNLPSESATNQCWLNKHGRYWVIVVSFIFRGKFHVMKMIRCRGQVYVVKFYQVKLRNIVVDKYASWRPINGKTFFHVIWFAVSFLTRGLDPANPRRKMRFPARMPRPTGTAQASILIPVLLNQWYFL